MLSYLSAFNLSSVLSLHHYCCADIRTCFKQIYSIRFSFTQKKKIRESIFYYFKCYIKKNVPIEEPITTPEPATTAVTPGSYVLSREPIYDGSYATQVEACNAMSASPVVLSSDAIIEDFMNSDIMSGKVD